MRHSRFVTGLSLAALLLAAATNGEARIASSIAQRMDRLMTLGRHLAPQARDRQRASVDNINPFSVLARLARGSSPRGLPGHSLAPRPARGSHARAVGTAFASLAQDGRMTALPVVCVSKSL